jgi:hypothetical protein
MFNKLKMMECMKTDLFTYNQRVMEASKIGGLALMARLYPCTDQLKKKEAYEIAGKQWLDWHVEKGNIKPYRVGPAVNSASYFSRLEIATLQYAEKELKYGDEEWMVIKKEDSINILSPQVSQTSDQPQSPIPTVTDQPQSCFNTEFTAEQQRRLYEALKVGLFIPESVDFSFFCEVLNNEYH